MDSVPAPTSRSARSRRAAAAPRRGHERARLDAEMAALRERTADEEGFRLAAIALVAAALEGGRGEGGRLLEEGGKGLACAARLSDLQDEIIGVVHDIASGALRSGKSAPSAPRLTVVA